MDDVSEISPICKQNLRVLADAYCKARGVKLATVSRYTTSDPHTLSNMRRRKDASVTLRIYDRAIKWLTDRRNWPEGTYPPAIQNPSHGVER